MRAYFKRYSNYAQVLKMLGYIQYTDYMGLKYGAWRMY